MNTTQEEYKCISAPTYSAALFFANFYNIKCNEFSLTSGRRIVCDASKFAVPELIEKMDDCFVIHEKAAQAQKKLHINSLAEVINIAKNYKYICADDESLITPWLECSYIDVQPFANTFEGIAWCKIFELFSAPIESSLFDELQVYSSIRLINHFPYIENSYLQHDSFIKKIKNLVAKNLFVELYELLVCKTPCWNPKTKDLSFFKQAVTIENFSGAHYLIHKSIAQYVKGDDVVYIGSLPAENTTMQIIYEPQFQKHLSWDAIKKDPPLGKLQAKNLDLKTGKMNFYGYLKNLLIASIQNTKQDNVVNDWEEFLAKSGVEYIKILRKMQKMRGNFYEFSRSRSFEKIEFKKQWAQEFFCDIWCESLNDIVILNFVWNYSAAAILRDKIYESMSEIPKLSQMLFISSEGIHEFDFMQKFEIKNAQFAQSIEDDLFYWYA